MTDSIQNSRAEDVTCPSAAYQTATVCVPVTVTPFANPQGTVTKCCGTPVVTPGRNTCEGTKKGSCIFTITQDICVTVPVEFGATTDVGDPYVTCTGVSEEDVCTNCGEPEAGEAAF